MTWHTLFLFLSLFFVFLVLFIPSPISNHLLILVPLLSNQLVSCSLLFYFLLSHILFSISCPPFSSSSLWYPLSHTLLSLIPSFIPCMTHITRIFPSLDAIFGSDSGQIYRSSVPFRANDPLLQVPTHPTVSHPDAWYSTILLSTLLYPTPLLSTILYSTLFLSIFPLLYPVLSLSR